MTLVAFDGWLTSGLACSFKGGIACFRKPRRLLCASAPRRALPHGFVRDYLFFKRPAGCPLQIDMPARYEVQESIADLVSVLEEGQRLKDLGMALISIHLLASDLVLAKRGLSLSGLIWMGCR